MRNFWYSLGSGCGPATVTAVSALFLLAGLSAPLSAGKAKTGTFQKGLYSDARFGFHLTIPDSWKVQLKDDPALVRIIVTKRHPEIDPRLRNTPESATIPTILVLADTTALDLDTVKVWLWADDPRLPNRREWRKVLPELTGSDAVRQERPHLAGQPALQVTFQKPYTVQIPLTTNPNYFETVQEFQMGTVTLVKRDGVIYLIYFICDRQFFRINLEQVAGMLASWQFTGP